MEIVVLDAHRKQCQELCSMIEKRHYHAIPMNSLLKMENYIKGNTCTAVIMDIDTVSVDNRTIRELTIQNPGVYFFCLSRDKFHPELKDAICYHIYACLNKPVDPDELFYLLKSVYENGKDEAKIKNHQDV